MKKVLSVVLAAAMVLGMSVSSFALTFTSDSNTSRDSKEYTEFGKSDSSKCYHGTADEIDIEDVVFVENFAVNGNWYAANGEKWDLNKVTLNPGDVITFVPKVDGTTNIEKLDKHWTINMKANKYVESAKFVKDEANNRYVVKVTLKDTLDNLKAQEISLSLYIADKYDGKVEESDGVSMKLPFDNQVEKYVSFDKTNDVDYTAKWVVNEDEKGTAIFDFNDDAYFTVKMIPEEKVILGLSTSYDKNIDKKYNEYDADLLFFNFEGSNDTFTKVGELFLPVDDDYAYIYEVVDGELVEVENAKYVEDYEVEGYREMDGWVIDTKELGYYVVADDELVVEEVEDTDTTTPATPDKTNPSTGANDFVGAAVALAVVSVAAAGALAFKK